MSDLLTTAEVADRFRVSESTVRWWRHVRTGPPSFRLNGAVRYRLDDVDAWERDQYEATSTNSAKGIA